MKKSNYQEQTQLENLFEYLIESQVTNIRKTMAKTLDSGTSLVEKIRVILREQGITITSVLTAFKTVIATIDEAFTGSSRPTLNTSVFTCTNGCCGDAKKTISSW